MPNLNGQHVSMIFEYRMSNVEFRSTLKFIIHYSIFNIPNTHAPW